MSADDTGKDAGGQALDVEDDFDESFVPTAPMRAVPPPPKTPKPSPVDFDDDEDEGPVGSRPGSTSNPFTETPHSEIPLPSEAAARVEAAQAQRKPNMGKVVALSLLWLVLLGGVIFGVAKAAGLMG